jgi:hypothetical protein
MRADDVIEQDEPAELLPDNVLHFCRPRPMPPLRRITNADRELIAAVAAQVVLDEE